MQFCCYAVFVGRGGRTLRMFFKRTKISSSTRPLDFSCKTQPFVMPVQCQIKPLVHQEYFQANLCMRTMQGAEHLVLLVL